MLDHAFQRRREIERMLLSGKKLTMPKLINEMVKLFCNTYKEKF